MQGPDALALETLLVERDEHTVTLTLNRPEKLNSLSRQLLSELYEVLRALERDPIQRPRALVLTGAGEKAFAAGADIEEMTTLSVSEAYAFSALGMSVMDTMEHCSFPIVAAVRGFALGGGCELALAADFVIAAENAVFGQPEVKLGLLPGFGGTQRLARRVGVAKARQLIYSGETVKAAEAKALGLVAEVVPKADLLTRARAVASRIAANAPLAVAAAKRTINEGLDLNLRAGSELESRAFAGLFASEDAKQGLEAFLAKRGAASFTGR
ncbi:MAG TPA: enoyl-CoA hydratase-related protein [Polyangiaceae bacterium]